MFNPVLPVIAEALVLGVFAALLPARAAYRTFFCVASLFIGAALLLHALAGASEAVKAFGWLLAGAGGVGLGLTAALEILRKKRTHIGENTGNPETPPKLHN